LVGQPHLGKRTQKFIEQAKSAFEKSLVIDPEFVPALISLADAHMLLGDDSICYGRTPTRIALENALPFLDKAEHLNPKSEELHASRAFYFLLMSDFDKAQTHAEKAITINPNCSKSYRTLGFILKRGASPRALVLRTREKALHLDPASPIDLINLFEELPVRNRFADAKAILDRIKAVDPLSVFYDWGRFSIAWNRGHLKEALAVYETSSRLLGDRQWAFGFQQALTLFGYGQLAENWNLATALEVYCNYGLREDAQRVGAQLTNGASRATPPPTTMALWHVLEGRYEEANEVLREHEEADPDKWGALYNLDDFCLGARLAWFVKDKLGDAEAADHYCLKLQEFYAVRYVDHDGIHKAINYLGACIANMKGNTQIALSEMKNQVSRFPISSYKLFFDPMLVSLSGEPEFQELKKETEIRIETEKQAALASGLLPPAPELFHLT
jgi:tetratricopeptide (TPR) repeat protein